MNIEETTIQKLSTILEKMKILEELQNCKKLEDFQSLTSKYENLCKDYENLPSVTTSVEQQELSYRAIERKNALDSLRNCTQLEEFQKFVNKYDWSCVWERYLVHCVSREERYECEAHEKAIRDYNQMMFEARERGIKEGIIESQLLIYKENTELSFDEIVNNIAEEFNLSLSETAKIAKEYWT